MSDLSNVRVWAVDLPVDPMMFPRPAEAADFLARHRGCFRERRTIVGSRIVETGAPCANEAEHPQLALRIPSVLPVPSPPKTAKETT